MLVYSLDSSASPERVWHFLAFPERWPVWAPHLPHSVGFGPGQVAPGRWGLLFVGGLLPLGAQVTEVVPSESWAWQLGPVRVDHRVIPVASGSRISVSFEGPLLAKAALQAFYAPLLERALLALSEAASD